MSCGQAAEIKGLAGRADQYPPPHGKRNRTASPRPYYGN